MSRLANLLLVLLLQPVFFLVCPLPNRAQSLIDQGQKTKAGITEELNESSFAEDNCVVWVNPRLPIKAIVLCIHGLGLHQLAYKPLAKALAQEGIATYALDVRGFGLWMQANGHEKVDFDRCMEDVRHLLVDIHKVNANVPVFLVGESMGGSVAIQVAALNPELVSGVIVSVPANDRFESTKLNIKVAFYALGNADRPFNIGKSVVKQATQKEELRQAWTDDPLSRLNISAKELMQFDHFMKKDDRAARKITGTPVLMLQGSKDRLVKPESSLELFGNFATADKQFLLVQDAEHLILQDGQFSDHIIHLLSTWIDTHSSRHVENLSKCWQAH